MNGIIQTPQERGQALAAMERMQEGITALAEMLRVTNERMQALEAAVRTLEKVTPGQAARINKAIRERAWTVCEDWRMGVWITPVRQGVGQVAAEKRFEADRDALKALAAAIRKTVKEMTGARTMREVARCDYDSVIALVIDWEDYEAIQGIRKKVAE